MGTLSPKSGSPFAYELRIKYEPFYVDYHMNQETATLPRMFNMQHLKEVAPKALLCDPAGNIFQVVVEIKGDEAVFTQGWNALGKFYGLHMGGWVRLVFVASDLFLMQLKDRLDRIVHYPVPARFVGIGDPPMIIGPFQKEAITTHCDQIFRKPDMYHVLEKELTNADVTSGFLHIPQEFCKLAFRKSGIAIVVFDEYGFQATCYVEFENQNPNLCGVTEGWERFTSHRKVFEGLRVQLAVPAGNPHMMGVSAVHVAEKLAN